ncbi:DNA repair protein RadA-like protein [Candidatus Clavichlamydia salmonicola]|uniref:DNA repair protein RadA n=1 Tax=Candidatus Clavichlamydia salmonicola TaxID=469812 RepID=UPI001890DCF4|nr:DNA repair protein RadA [Candidatus Clavichlamydia salmonicola]MBF5050928.1 DNA repair protein RadA-like protein [Candidatus Clavichlamydia salmonicola]
MTVKTKTIWACNDCGSLQKKWAGRCEECGEWNTLTEDKGSSTSSFYLDSKPLTFPHSVNDILPEKTARISLQMPELNRVMGGGIVPGSFILIGGDPGIGKSTLLLQVSDNLAQTNLKVLYVCGEESVNQTSLRAKRLNINSSSLFLLSETNLDHIKLHIANLKPSIVIIDSIQIIYKPTVTSSPGSVSQVRESAADLMHLAKNTSTTIFVIGHVTKGGEIAGPRVLEHLVDTVLYFEGDRNMHYRILRSIKNRFGPSNEIAVFEMKDNGLKENSNPSGLFLQNRSKNCSGSVIIPALEGSEAILVEIQALVTESVFSTPSRRTTGFDSNRLALLLAVMEKRIGYSLYRNDVFVSVAGGLKISEPGADLGVILAIASSVTNNVIDPSCIACGEVGLGGEIRHIACLNNRLKQAISMGFMKAFIPANNASQLTDEIKEQIVISEIHSVEEAIRLCL